MQSKKISLVLTIIALWAVLIALAKAYLGPAIAANTVAQLDSSSAAFSASAFINSTLGLVTIGISIISVIAIARILRTK